MKIKIEKMKIKIRNTLIKANPTEVIPIKDLGLIPAQKQSLHREAEIQKIDN